MNSSIHLRGVNQLMFVMGTRVMYVTWLWNV